MPGGWNLSLAWQSTHLNGTLKTLPQSRYGKRNQMYAAWGRSLEKLRLTK